MKTPNAKTFFAALAAVATVTVVAAPAAAQPYRDHDRYERGRYDHGYTSERVRTAERRIESGLREGELRPREARRLRMEVSDFARLEAHHRRGGLTRWERADLNRRYDLLIAQMRRELYDRQYGQGYGYRR